MKDKLIGLAVGIVLAIPLTLVAQSQVNALLDLRSTPMLLSKSGHNLTLGTQSTDDLLINQNGATVWTYDDTGTLIGSGTATIGWSVQAGADTACTTTCTTPCVFGVNTAATEADIVDCADATADECLCAGAS